MGNQCIYCGVSEDLSKSDVIPDALTNAKIINPNVCRVKHNNEFSDLFEDDVIKKLAVVTNNLNIKSSKSKNYALYSAQIKIEGKEYNTKIASETELFRNKKMRSIDGKHLIGPIEDINKIKDASEKSITQIDINQLEIEETVNLNLSVYFSESMYRMVAKIAFEWYCLHNNIDSKIDTFHPIIQFITQGIGEDIVTIVSNEEFYKEVENTTEFGSHTLLSYVAKDNSVNILVSFFGIAIYNIKVCESIIDEDINNVIFQELLINTQREQFKFDTFENLKIDFYNKFNVIKLETGIKAMIPKNMKDSLIRYQNFYIMNYSVLQTNLQFIHGPNEKVKNLILKNLVAILQSSAITLRGLKRFVKEHFNNFNGEIKLNPKGTNKKSVFMFYLLFTVGQSNDEIKSLDDLNVVLKNKFSGETIGISNELSNKLHEEIFATLNYSDIIIKGAKAINGWKYQ